MVSVWKPWQTKVLVATALFVRSQEFPTHSLNAYRPCGGDLHVYLAGQRRYAGPGPGFPGAGNKKSSDTQRALGAGFHL